MLAEFLPMLSLSDIVDDHRGPWLRFPIRSGPRRTTRGSTLPILAYSAGEAGAGVNLGVTRERLADMGQDDCGRIFGGNDSAWEELSELEGMREANEAMK